VPATGERRRAQDRAGQRRYNQYRFDRSHHASSLRGQRFWHMVSEKGGNHARNFVTNRNAVPNYLTARARHNSSRKRGLGQAMETGSPEFHFGGELAALAEHVNRINETCDLSRVTVIGHRGFQRKNRSMQAVQSAVHSSCGTRCRRTATYGVFMLKPQNQRRKLRRLFKQATLSRRRDPRRSFPQSRKHLQL
jgi:hypothetical protein